MIALPADITASNQNVIAKVSKTFGELKSKGFKPQNFGEYNITAIITITIFKKINLKIVSSFINFLL
jgi:hypothetical protein